MNKPRVLSLSTLFPTPARPGFGKFVEYSLGAVARRGDIDLTVVNPIGVPPWPLSRREPYRTHDSAPQQGELQGATVHYPRFTLVPRFGGDSNAGRIVRAVMPLVQKLHAERPFDLIDAQFFFPDGPAVAEIAKRLGLPWSIKARGADIHFWGRRPAPLAQMRAAAQGAAGMLAVSGALKGDMAALGMPGERITVHYTGIDHARFTPLPRTQARILVSAVPELGVWVKGPLVVVTGALIERKGQGLVIEALRHLPGVHLAFAGAGPDENALRALAARLDVEERVQFLGQVSHDLLPQLLSAANVLALPSASEGIANAWIEALACGTPLVIPDIGGAREVLRDPSAGRIVERTPQAIAAGIAEVLANQPDEETVAANSQRFSWERNAEELAAYWRRLAGK
ncbi:MAG: glycosyltransferase [Novosphingobium sp.]|uniref:glycosyltransferase n=1 Tax=Novosphingobium sp. TaxID=1874826 RepID=UPI001D7932CC|nr:glycosyltransferase [Novosphingobium sp.]MCB2057888.1 glycosyltransferase [Novosphingobium sp.]MCP5386907.1 glycosyltransferase [Novosphingobium sp.]